MTGAIRGIAVETAVPPCWRERLEFCERLVRGSMLIVPRSGSRTWLPKSEIWISSHLSVTCLLGTCVGRCAHALSQHGGISAIDFMTLFWRCGNRRAAPLLLDPHVSCS
jgi:hypothetical protein